MREKREKRARTEAFPDQAAAAAKAAQSAALGAGMTAAETAELAAASRHQRESTGR